MPQGYGQCEHRCAHSRSRRGASGEKSGKSRDEMPDIALMPSRQPQDTPLWIMDPKHSERRAYSLSNYSEVGKRHQSVFSALRTWVVEFYPRPDLGIENPRVIDEGVELVRDVSPDGAGSTYLINELHKLHGRPRQTVAMIDCSRSYEKSLRSAADGLRAFLVQGSLLFPDIIWFANTAARTHIDAGELERGSELCPPSGLGSGTNFGQAWNSLRESQRDASATRRS